MSSILENKSTIPFGAELKVLLNSDLISYGQIQNSLKSKGVFIGNSTKDKDIIAPLLSSMLLKPTEFSELIDQSIVRESKPKTRTALPLEIAAKDVDWISALKSIDFLEGIEVKKGMDSITFIDHPSLVVVSDNQKRQQISVIYKIKSKQYNKDWVNNELNFDAEISVVRKNGKLELNVTSSHTSKETEAINRILVSKVTKALYENKIVKNDELQRITFESFNNIERVRFFKRLTGGKPRILKAGIVDNIEINFDESAKDLPDDPRVVWMKNTVKRLKIDGEKLNDIFFITDESFYSCFHIQEMDIEYPFSVGTNKGICKVCIYFGSLTKKKEDHKKAELTCVISGMNFENIVNADAKGKVISKIDEALHELFGEKYQLMLSERKNK